LRTIKKEKGTDGGLCGQKRSFPIGPGNVARGVGGKLVFYQGGGERSKKRRGNHRRARENNQRAPLKKKKRGLFGHSCGCKLPYHLLERGGKRRLRPAPNLPMQRKKRGG